jgi:hypothetical protein
MRAGDNGTFIIDGYPSVSEDGHTQGVDWSRSYITTRDVNDEVATVIRDDGTTPPIVGVRLTPGEIVFPPLHAPTVAPEGEGVCRLGYAGRNIPNSGITCPGKATPCMLFRALLFFPC